MNEQELVMHIVKALASKPEEVSTSIVEGEKTTIIELKVAKEDLGKVIGKQGRTAKAIRTVISAGNNHSNKRITLEILE